VPEDLPPLLGGGSFRYLLFSLLFLLFSLFRLFFDLLLKPELRSARPASGGEWIPYGEFLSPPCRTTVPPTIFVLF
jgi:hypothetical protein